MIWKFKCFIIFNCLLNFVKLLEFEKRLKVLGMIIFSKNVINSKLILITINHNVIDKILCAK